MSSIDEQLFNLASKEITEESTEESTEEATLETKSITSETLSITSTSESIESIPEIKQIEEEYVGIIDEDIGSIIMEEGDALNFDEFEEQIDKAHNLLRGKESIVCSEFLEEIMHYLFLWTMETLEIDFEEHSDEYEFNEIRDVIFEEIGVTDELEESGCASFLEQVQNLGPHFIGVGLLRFCEMVRPLSTIDGEVAEEYDNEEMEFVYEEIDIIQIICQILEQHPLTELMFEMEPIHLFRSESRETIIDVINTLFYEDSPLEGALYSIDGYQRIIHLAEEELTTPERIEASEIMKAIEANNYVKIKEEQEQEISYDLVGDVYEYIEFEYDSDESSELGQFFSSRILVEFIIQFITEEEYINLSDCNQEYNVADLSGGTAGFLTHFNHYANKIGESDSIMYYYSELESNTFMWGLMNMLYSLHEPNVNIDNINMEYKCCDSLLEVDHVLYDLVLTNPPFGVSCMQFDDEYSNDEEEKVQEDKTEAEKVGMEIPENELYDILHQKDIKGYRSEFINHQEELYNLNNSYVKINPDDVFWDTNESAEFRFIQLYVYELEENGVCAMILPYGSMFFSSSHEEFRKEWMNRVAISDIIILPDGIFENTNVETCVVVFHETGSTECITFSELFSVKDVYNVEIMFELAHHELNSSCSLNYDDYLEEIVPVEEESNISFINYDELCNIYSDANILEHYESEKLRITQEFIDSNAEECEMVELSEICELKNGESEEEDDMKEGPYRMIGGGIKDVMSCDEFNIEGENVLISGSGSVGHLQYIDGRAFTNADCTNIVTKINKQYLYCVLEEKQSYLLMLKKGSCLPHLDKEKFLEIEIPILSDIKIKELNLLYDEIDTIINAIKIEKTQETEPPKIMLDKDSQIQLYEAEKLRITQEFIDSEECEIVKLSEICDLENGESEEEDDMEEGPYRMIGGGIKDVMCCDEFNIEGENVLISGSGSVGYLQYINDRVFTNSDCTNIITKINKEYLYCVLEEKQSQLLMLKKGSCLPHLDKEKFLEIEIPLLSDNKIKELNLLYDKYNVIINTLKTL